MSALFPVAPPGGWATTPPPRAVPPTAAPARAAAASAAVTARIEAVAADHSVANEWRAHIRTQVEHARRTAAAASAAAVSREQQFRALSPVVARVRRHHDQARLQAGIARGLDAAAAPAAATAPVLRNTSDFGSPRAGCRPGCDCPGCWARRTRDLPVQSPFRRPWNAQFYEQIEARDRARSPGRPELRRRLPTPPPGFAGLPIRASDRLSEERRGAREAGAAQRRSRLRHLEPTVVGPQLALWRADRAAAEERAARLDARIAATARSAFSAGWSLADVDRLAAEQRASPTSELQLEHGLVEVLDASPAVPSPQPAVVSQSSTAAELEALHRTWAHATEVVDHRTRPPVCHRQIFTGREVAHSTEGCGTRRNRPLSPDWPTESARARARLSSLLGTRLTTVNAAPLPARSGGTAADLGTDEDLPDLVSLSDTDSERSSTGSLPALEWDNEYSSESSSEIIWTHVVDTGPVASAPLVLPESEAEWADFLEDSPALPPPDPAQDQPSTDWAAIAAREGSWPTDDSARDAYLQEGLQNGSLRWLHQFSEDYAAIQGPAWRRVLAQNWSFATTPEPGADRITDDAASDTEDVD